MRIAIVHGYFLADSGSGIYVRELARAFVALGHDVTLVCQERTPERYDFIDAGFALNSNNRDVAAMFSRPRRYAGSCRFVRPDIHGLLLTYVASGTTVFENHTFQDATSAQIESFVGDHIAALTTVFRRWPPDAIQANHAVMQPFEAAQARRAAGLENTSLVMTIHGSALHFSVKADPRLAPYFTAGAEAAKTIAALSESSAADAAEIAASLGVDIRAKTLIIPPGVDTRLFRPRQRGEAFKSPAGVFAGRLLWTKGPQYAIAAMPFILRECPDFELRLAGEGPLEPVLRRQIEILASGDIAGAAAYLKQAPEMGGGGAWGAVMPELDPNEAAIYIKAARRLPERVTFLGHLAHAEMAAAFAAADVALMPSVFPEAYGLAAIEAAAAGAVPIATYQTGLKAPLDIMAAALSDPALTVLRPNGGLTRDLADAVIGALKRYPTRDEVHRRRLHEIAEHEFSWERAALAYLAAF